jgi:ribosomal protein L9
MRRHLFVSIAALLLASPGMAAQQPRSGPSPADTDKLEAAAANIARMKAALKQVLGRAEQARNEKDVVKLNCVNEKLTQMKALIKVAEQADIALHESVASKDSTGAADFSKIAIARTKVDGLRADSEQCVGQLAYMVDEKTTVEVEQPAGLPSAGGPGLGVANRGDNPADGVGQVGGGGRDVYTPPVIVRPPAASPYR